MTPENLIIRRPFDNVVIESSKVTSVEILDDERLKWMIRTFGVGGLFGFYGRPAWAEVAPAYTPPGK